MLTEDFESIRFRLFSFSTRSTQAHKYAIWCTLPSVHNCWRLTDILSTNWLYGNGALTVNCRKLILWWVIEEECFTWPESRREQEWLQVQVIRSCICGKFLILGVEGVLSAVICVDICVTTNYHQELFKTIIQLLFLDFLFRILFSNWLLSNKKNTRNEENRLFSFTVD